MIAKNRPILLLFEKLFFVLAINTDIDFVDEFEASVGAMCT